MFSKTTLFLAFTALARFAVAAPPPACLLGAVNQYEDPADISAVCKAKDATTKIAKICGDATEDALSAFADICNEAGVKVSTDVPKTTGSSTKTATAPYGTGNSTAAPSGSGATTLATAAPTGGAGSGSPSATASGSPAESTGAAGKLEVGVAALLAGLMAIAL